MPVRSAKSHRPRRPARDRAEARQSEVGDHTDAPGDAAEAEAEPARAAPEPDSVDARVAHLRDAFQKLRLAVHDVRTAAVALARGEVQAFARRGRRLRART